MKRHIYSTKSIKSATSFEDLKAKDVVVVKEKKNNTAGYTPVTVKGVENNKTFFSGTDWGGNYKEYTKDRIVYYAKDMNDAMKWISKKIGVPMKEIKSCWIS